MRPTWGKNIFLFGDIGSGKTTLLKGFSRGLQIDSHINSPTFSLVAEYPIPKNPMGLTIFSHLDIFRVDEESPLGLPEISEKLEDPSLVFALEWAEKFPKDSFSESRIEIHLSPEKTNMGRNAEVLFFDPGVPNDEVIRELLDEYATPLHIKKHTATVTKLATSIADAFIQQKYPVNIQLVRAAGLLHHLLWICEEKDLDRSNLSKTLNDEAWEKLQQYYTKCKTLNHAEAACTFLHKRGFFSTGDVIANYNGPAIFYPLSREEQCLYLANCYVWGNHITPLHERLRASPEKSGIPRDETIKNALLALEKDVSKRVHMTPEEIIQMGEEA